MLRYAFLLPAMLIAASPLSNSGFEENQPGEVPSGWKVTIGQPEYTWTTSTDCAGRPGQCAKAVWNTDRPLANSAWTNLMRTVDATPYRGKRVRLKGWAHVSNGTPRTWAALWLRSDLADKSMGFFDNMQDRPIAAGSWQSYEIVGDIEENAQSLALGMMLHNGGVVRFDDVELEILGDTPMQKVPARQLTDKGLRNLVALSKLYGYVRYFYPAAISANTDWAAFLMEAIPAVEDAEDLADALRKQFEKIAPEVRIGELGPAVPVMAKRVIAWKHLGVGISKQSTYRSELQLKATTEGRVPAPYEAELAPGVRVRVPMALPAPDALPTVTPAATNPKLYQTSINRTARLATVMMGWNVFQHFYPYFDIAGTDWPQQLNTALAAVAKEEGAPAMNRSLSLMVAALKDGHGSVNGPGALARANVPLTVDRIDGRFVVTHVADAPGQAIARGDIIHQVNGRPIEQLYEERAARVSGATPQWIRFQVLRGLLAGDPKIPAVLEIEPFGAPPDIRRSVTLERKDIAPKEPRPGRTKELQPGIWYVNLDDIQQAEWRAAVPQLVTAKGIVFDMRGYPGMGPEFLQHLTKKNLASAQWHVPLTLAPDRSSVEWNRQGEWNLRPMEPYLPAKRVFLLNGGAISYAESVMGIVEAFQLGEIVGEASAGTNGNVNPFTLPGGYNVSWTGMKVIKHDGTTHHGVGIRPTVPVIRTRAGVAEGRDEYLDKALELLRPML